MKAKTPLSILGMAALAAASLVYLDRLGLEHDAFADKKTASLSIPDTNGLVVGSRVLVRGIPVGHVTEVHSSAGGIRIDWNYDRKYRIPVDSRFRVDNLSALGETYLAVVPAAAGPYLTDDAVIPADHVVVPTTFKELSERLTVLLEQVEPDRVRRIFETVDTALPDDPWVLGDLSRAGELLAGMLIQQSTNLTTVLSGMQPILRGTGTVPGDLASATPILGDFGSGFRDLLAGISFAASFGPLKDGIEFGAGPLLDQLQAFLDDTAADLHTLGVELLPGVRAAGAAMATVNIGQLLDNATAAVASGDAVTVRVRPPGR
ncbi:MlaD family protein [Nocardia bovistercoris]|uniref:MCE family protein n=1 Tax=Nocardia bovistercoris TaxID=2785916 RepID=A0A931IIL1_9NOCA|nr:MlaD family protein [Nocardia bovistercoris]MBH0781020.1 MCE family protein [Nocardia bovistercoris]